MDDRDPSRQRHEQEANRRRGEHNEIGYRNVDEERQHDEAGSQGEGAGEPPARDSET